MKAASRRLQLEIKDLRKNPLPGLRTSPSPSNLLEWHYVLEGSDNSDYAGGFYYGKLVFPDDYPFKPPSIMMITPSGRFKPATRICLSISDFHPEEWNPMWGIRGVLLGLQSFFYENDITTGALHGVPTSEKKNLAAESLAYNVKILTFRKLFPELVDLHDTRQKEEATKAIQVVKNESEQRTEDETVNVQAAQHLQNDQLRRLGQNGMRMKELLLGALLVAILAVVVANAVLR